MTTRTKPVGTWDFASFAEVHRTVQDAMAELAHLGLTVPPRTSDRLGHCGCAACAQRCGVCAAMAQRRE